MITLLLWTVLAAQSPVGGHHLEVPEGLQVQTWAESPLLYNPTAMDVDGRGALWVTEAVNYRKWGGKNPGRDHPDGDRVVVLRDLDGDGRADSSVVFAQGEELVSPLGICVLGPGRVLVSCSPNAILYVDEDGDDVADRHEIFLTGFGGHNHDHGLHSFVHGPAGDLYMAAGNAGPHLVRDRAGWNLRSGSIYVGGGPFTADNKPGLRSDDGLAWTGGLAMRVGLDGKGLGVMAHNFRNNYEVALDSFGNMFLSDNDDDGNRGCRTLWAMEGANYGYFSADGTRSWKADQRPGQSIPSAHWHQEDPGVAPAGTITGAGGPTGVTVYEGRRLARWIDGAVLNADAGAGIVYAHRPRLEGAGYTLDDGWLIRGARGDKSERARWFRPSDVCASTDGSVFVADWYDPGVGGHHAGDSKAYGRILRITAGESQAPALDEPVIDLGLDDGWQAFFSPAKSAGSIWREANAGTPALVRALLGALEREGPAREKAQILFHLATHESGHGDTVRQFLKHADPELRVAALRALRAGSLVTDADLAFLAEDSSPVVRREALVFLRGHEADEASADLILKLAGSYDGLDRNYLEAFGLAASGREEEIYSRLVAALGTTPSRWDEPFAGLAWRLHPESAMDAFSARAADSTLSMGARMQSLDALAFMQGRPAAEAVATLALTAGGEVQLRAGWWLRHRDTNDWREYDLARELQTGDFARAELLWKSGVMNSGTQEARVELSGATRLWLVVDDGGNGNSCDWAAWIEPTLRTTQGDVRLIDTSWVEAQAEWGAVRIGKNCSGGVLSVDGTPVKWGIGTHAASTIEYQLPAGAEELRFEVGPDDGGVRQGATSIEFRVYVERPKDRSEFLASQALALNESASREERERAVRALAADPEGGLFLIRAARSNELPHELRTVAAEDIFSNPDISVRALASEFFERPGEGALALPAIAELMALEGDPVRGRELFQDKQTLCSTCHTHSGLGRDIGPDLSAIHVKYGRAELLDTILNPSAGIALGYESWVFETKEQGWLSGFLLADGDVIVLKDSTGLRHVIPREEVLYRELQRVSLMPAGLALGLGSQGLADLLAFLGEGPDQAPVFGETEVLFDGSSMNDWEAHLSGGKASMEDVWSIEADGVLRCKGRPAGYIYTKQSYRDFELELDWRFDPELGAGNSGVLLRMVGKHKVWPKSIEAQLQSRSAGDIWNIDKVGMLVDLARTSGRRTKKLAPSSEKPLGEWNHYRILLDRGKLALYVNGVLQNEARWCDEVAGPIGLQSEGAEIQFRNVKLRPIIGHTPR